MRNKTKAPSLARKGRLPDTKLLLIITICVFVVMYVCAVLFLGSGFKKPQTFFNILNENAALLILSCGMSLVMITGGTMLTGGVGNIIGTLFCVLSLSTIKNIVSSLGLDEAWWTNITVSAMICLFLVIQSLVLSRKNKDE